MAASTSTAASSAVSHSNKYDQWFEVFINHRGVDVKKTFAKDLYNNLRSIGLRAFLDEDELQRGFDFPSQIKHAIETASAHVAILSERYAESIWCLRELVMMLDSNKPIFPVFYGVTPAEVRWTRGKKGKYAQALQKLAEKKTDEGKLRYDSVTIEKWRIALFRVADISGFELEESDIGEEVELKLLDKLVRRLSDMLKKPDLHVADYPTGLDDKLEDFEDTVLLQLQESRKHQILGIVGLGGVGKTTFAKHFFNKKKSDYHKSCFLSDVRDNARKGFLNSLQRKLLKDLTGLDKPIDSVHEGMGLLKKYLKSSCVDEGNEMQTNHLKSSHALATSLSNALVILDDVDNKNQVDSLLPVDLGSGSLILITFRDKDVLRSPRVEMSSIYTLKPLTPPHSEKLFCSYAFGQPSPAPEFKSLVNDFLNACKGLPLSLKVIGALLYGRDVSDWKDELVSLQQIVPAEIYQTFMISYNSLNKEEKEIFLDIACFFIGQNRDTAIGIWDKSGWRGRRGFQNLQNKCLVEVDSRNQIQMHDHVRDLRIEVAEDATPRRVWRWTKDVVYNKLLLPTEIPVRGIRMVHGEHNGPDEDIVFGLIDTDIARLERIFRRLHILETENAILERVLRRVELPDLIWLSWEKCPHSSLPSWVPLKNLRFLKVSESALNTLWHNWEGESEGSLQLPVCLEELWAGGCVNLRSIRGLALLTKLRHLEVGGCSELEELPSMETFASLEKLLAIGCVKLNSIRGLEPLTKLRHLEVGGCSELEELPSMETLASLEELCAHDCVKLKRIHGLAQATMLKVLCIYGCSELKELEGLAQCTELWHLNVNGCSKLKELPSMETLVSLEELRAYGCNQLKSIRGLAQSTKLLHLSVCGCVELEEVEGVEDMLVEMIDASKCPKLQCPVWE